jgi:hypothetical protein
MHTYYEKYITFIFYAEDGSDMLIWNINNQIKSMWHHKPEDHSPTFI